MPIHKDTSGLELCQKDQSYSVRDGILKSNSPKIDQ